MITCQKQTPYGTIPQSKSKNSAQIKNTIISPLFVGMNDGLAIGTAAESMSSPLQVYSQRRGVVDLPVAGQPDRAVFVAERLLPGAEVDDAQSAVPQRYARLDGKSRKAIETRVGAFRKLAPEKQRAILEQAEAWKRLPKQEQDRIRSLSREQQRTAFRNALAKHRRQKLLRKLTPAERKAIADVPDRELRHAIHGLMQKRREEQMRRLPDAVRAQLAALPPGKERDKAFRIDRAARWVFPLAYASMIAIISITA